MTRIGPALVLLGALNLPCFAAEFFVSPQGSHEPPFATWATAATNIQDAIDAAAASDTVWVTNGLYSSGGRTMGNALTNRVVLDKALTVQSVNGPEFTTIMGAWDANTNGPAAVRCAWLTNGAVLKGFTLFRGATAPFGLSATNLSLGGGVWGASTNAIVENCVITTNSASVGGAGAFRVSLIGCTLVGNSVPLETDYKQSYRFGGGAYFCFLNRCQLRANALGGKGGGVSDSRSENCSIVGNYALRAAGGAHRSKLINCTVTENLTGDPSVAFPGGAVWESSLTNCIVYSNRAYYGSRTNYNFTDSVLSYSCSSPLPLGEGNINSDPQLLSDSIHLAESSPCRGAGTNLLSGYDIDGQPWQSPPSMGCDEWQPSPLLLGGLRIEPSGTPVSLRILSPPMAGASPTTFWWTRDGNPLQEDGHFVGVNSANLRIQPLGPGDIGSYQMTVSNQFGVATVEPLDLRILCVDPGSGTPNPPYASWDAAATNIQDAIDQASPGAVILVTNGVYATGGRAVGGGPTNRVALQKPLVVAGVNGAKETIIQGAWDPATTNGPSAVRCAWLSDGATLSGFTLRGGATLATGDSDKMQSGGGACGTSTNALILNCVLRNNSAAFSGGGCASLTARSCLLLDNTAYWAGGGHKSDLVNCLVTRNTIVGVSAGSIVNCTVVRNRRGGDSLNSARNSIIYYNYYSAFSPATDLSVPYEVMHCCTTRLSLNHAQNSIDADPQILGDYQLAVTSPCRGAGSAAFVSGTDLDGQLWANPPSVGCSEVWESERVGPLSVGLSSSLPEVTQGGRLTLLGSLTGSATRVGWDFGDGNTLTNQSLMSPQHTWTNPGDYSVMFTAYNTEQVNGVSTNLVVHVIPLEVPQVASPELVGTNFSLTFSTQPGVTYAVQRATNLTPPVVWQTLTSTYATGKYDFNYTDTKATNDTSFYRLFIP